ncbi:MAG: amidohydrolase [Alistipes sp.]|nr:amidohydrolase [Candidatus Alistipes equi]
MKRSLLTILAFIFVTHLVYSRTPRKDEAKLAIDYLERNFATYDKIQKYIWDASEPAFQEYKSSDILSSHLRGEGFDVTLGVASMPTAFVARYGKGRPVIGILAEYDALPGLSQDTIPFRSPRPGKKFGHGCGHNLIGTASVASAVALSRWLKSSGTEGTIIVYGTPGEEGGSGKAYMAREGLFSMADIVFDWHPGRRQYVYSNKWLAMVSVVYRFYGKSAHASAHPDDGRSALDAVESMDFMTNLMREHIPDGCKLHYVIVDGGVAPNVVPEYASVKYNLRARDTKTLLNLIAWVGDIADAAALGTQTRVEKEILSGSHEKIINRTLSVILQKNLEMVGTPVWDERETAFVKQIHDSFNSSVPFENHTIVQPLAEEQPYGSGGSSDVGDVSWIVPEAGFEIQTFAPASGGHTWANVAVAGTSIGTKSLIAGAKVLVSSCIDVFINPDIVTKAKAELENKRGKDYTYSSLLGNRLPSLDMYQKD